jgi:hypothetical protein
MPRDSGVLAAPLVATRNLVSTAQRPGDIDILLIPYEGDELILDRAMGIEVKAIRATFARQGKSPNDYGFSQANALVDLGFPYVSVAHLTVLDSSPREAWRRMMAAAVINSEGEVGENDIDAMPIDLIQRVYGRLESNCLVPTIGLLSAYINHPQVVETKSGRTTWIPEGREAAQNSFSAFLLDALERYYLRNSSSFIAIPRFDPTD